MRDFLHGLEENIQLLWDILLEMSDFVCIKDGEGRWVYVHENDQNILLFKTIDLVGKTSMELIQLFPHLRHFFESSIQSDEQAWTNGKMTHNKEHFYNIFDRERIYDVIKFPLYHPDGGRNRLLITGKDVTAVRKNEEDLALKMKELESFKFALDQASIVAITDASGVITYVNDKFCEISKYSREELIGSTHRLINSRHHPKGYFAEMWSTIQAGRVWQGTIKNRAKDGTFYWVKTTIVPFVNEKGKPFQYIAIRQDITDQKETEEQILYNAFHDEVTNLRNRRSFNYDLDRLIKEHAPEDEFALLFLDLNRLKFINDTYGHSIGDQIIFEVSTRLSDYCQENMNLYRFGGDEFIVVVKSGLKEEIQEVANQIFDILRIPFFIKKERIYISASIGVSFFPKDGKDIDSLVKKADSAMFHAKKRGSNAIAFYSLEKYEEMTKTIHLERELRQAIEEESLTLYYQPQVNLCSTEIVGVEALLRWNHPTLGNISPVEFIPLAEETGLITPITEWVLMTACRQNKAWQDKGVAPIKVAVNISPYLFREDLVEMVKRVLSATALKPCYLELEITESSMEHPERNIPILKELKALGVQISVDDFGTGYSSLAYLRHFPIDRLKIDRSFINEIHEDNGVIVKTIINMALHLNLSVTAEGIEDNEQHQFLCQLECPEGQGYLFSRAIPSEEIYKMLKK